VPLNASSSHNWKQLHRSSYLQNLHPTAIPNGKTLIEGCNREICCGGKSGQIGVCPGIRAGHKFSSDATPMTRKFIRFCEKTYAEISGQLTVGLPRVSRRQYFISHHMLIRQQAKETKFGDTTECERPVSASIELRFGGYVMNMAIGGKGDPDIYIRQANHRN
jgi:hypothetical protein